MRGPKSLGPLVGHPSLNTALCYSITTDNASNNMKCGQLMYEEIEEALNHELEGHHDEQDFLCETTIEANLVNATNQLDLNIRI